MKKILIIAGSDKVGISALNSIENNEKFKNISLVIDYSSNSKRIIKLIQRGSISVYLIFKLFIANLLREKKKIACTNKVFNRKDFIVTLDKVNPEIVILFRCGLILTEDVLNKKIDFLNIHASSLPKYGGLGTIQKAINNKDFKQNVTLHKVTKTIDGGEILFEEPYEMNPKFNYFKNENIAYLAAEKLLIKTLNNLINAD